jgi:repressor LexA
MAKLCDTVDLSSTSSVFALIWRLVDAGYLERVGRRIAVTRRFFARPQLSPVRAGQPQPSSQEEPETLTLDDYLIDDPNRTSLHKVRGDSMRDAGILESDLVVVEHHTPTEPGTSS